MSLKTLCLMSLCLLVGLTGCTAMVDVEKIGNEYAQHAYSRNAWWPNWDRTIFCDDLDENGYCPKKSHDRHTVVAIESVGQGATKQVASGIPTGAGLAYGLSNMDAAASSSSANQSVQQPGPWRGHYGHR